MEPRPHRQERRLWAALVGSGLLHLALALWVARAGSVLTAPAPCPRPVPVDLVWLDAAPAPHSAPPALPETPSRSQSLRAESKGRAHDASPLDDSPARPPAFTPSVAKQSRGAPPGPAGSSRGEAAGALLHPLATSEGARPPASTGPQPADAPRTELALLPRLGALGGSLPAPEPSHGRTLTPADLPTAAQLRVEEELRVGGLVESDAKNTLANARVTNGLVDPYYAELRRTLQQDTAEAPDFTDAANPKNLAGTWVRSWQAGAERYAKTGAPFDAPVTREAQPELPFALQREIERGSPMAAALGVKLRAGQGLRDFGEGKLGIELYAEVQLDQSPTGALQRLVLVQPSGISTFDAWVTERAVRAIDALGPRDPAAFPKGLRSVFGFTGKVSYMRKAGDLDLAADAPYLVATTLLGLVPGLGALSPGSVGTFDEVTGQAYYVDLRHPHYECRVKLLRVYDGLD